jgi:hypothetical protein
LRRFAAQAAIDTIASGDGLDAAMAAATNRWAECNHGQRSFVETTLLQIWLRRGGWLYALFAVCAQVFWYVPLGWIAVLALTPLPLAAAVWHFYVAYRLYNYGVVAPGVLVAVTTKDSDGQPIYVGTYRWQFHGPRLTKRSGSTPHDVQILFDPAHPQDALVIDRPY